MQEGGFEKISEMVYKSVNGAGTRCQWMRKREVNGKKEGVGTIVQQRSRDKKGMEGALLNQPTSRTTQHTQHTPHQGARWDFTDDQSHRLSAESILARALICALPTFGASPLSCPCPLDPCPGPPALCPRAWDAKSVVLVAASCLY
jgi:hypothetical protein